MHNLTTFKPTADGGLLSADRGEHVFGTACPGLSLVCGRHVWRTFVRGQPRTVFGGHQIADRRRGTFVCRQRRTRVRACLRCYPQTGDFCQQTEANTCSRLFSLLSADGGQSKTFVLGCPPSPADEGHCSANSAKHTWQRSHDVIADADRLTSRKLFCPVWCLPADERQSRTGQDECPEIFGKFDVPRTLFEAVRGQMSAKHGDHRWETVSNKTVSNTCSPLSADKSPRLQSA